MEERLGQALAPRPRVRCVVGGPSVADEHHAVAGLGERLRHGLGHDRRRTSPVPAGAMAMTSGLGSRSRIVARSRRMVVSSGRRRRRAQQPGAPAGRRTAATTGSPSPRPRPPTGPLQRTARAARRAGTRARVRRARRPRASASRREVRGARGVRGRCDHRAGGDSLFSSAVRWARRLTSSLRRASASSAWNRPLGRAALLGGGRGGPQVVDHAQGLRLHALDPRRVDLVEAPVTVVEVGGGHRVRDLLGHHRVARRVGDLEDLRVRRAR